MSISIARVDGVTPPSPPILWKAVFRLLFVVGVVDPLNRVFSCDYLLSWIFFSVFLIQKNKRKITVVVFDEHYS